MINTKCQENITITLSIKSSICYCLISANYFIYYFQNKNVPQKSNEKCYIEQNEIYKITNNM